VKHREFPPCLPVSRPAATATRLALGLSIPRAGRFRPIKDRIPFICAGAYDAFKQCLGFLRGVAQAFSGHHVKRRDVLPQIAKGAQRKQVQVDPAVFPSEVEGRRRFYTCFALRYYLPPLSKPSLGSCRISAATFFAVEAVAGFLRPAWPSARPRPITEILGQLFSGGVRFHEKGPLGRDGRKPGTSI